MRQTAAAGSTKDTFDINFMPYKLVFKCIFSYGDSLPGIAARLSGP
jgi:hypothetical protein